MCEPLEIEVPYKAKLHKQWCLLDVEDVNDINSAVSEILKSQGSSQESFQGNVQSSSQLVSSSVQKVHEENGSNVSKPAESLSVVSSVVGLKKDQPGVTCGNGAVASRCEECGHLEEDCVSSDCLVFRADSQKIYWMASSRSQVTEGQQSLCVSREEGGHLLRGVDCNMAGVRAASCYWCQAQSDRQCGSVDCTRGAGSWDNKCQARYR